MSAAGPRLFVAIAPPTALVAPLFEEVRARLDGAASWLRFPRLDGLHVTLSFLGALEQDQRERVVAALGERGPLPAPQLELGAGDAFPARGRERVLWLRARPAPRQEQALERLVSAVRAAVREALQGAGDDGGDDGGAAPDAAWRPHLTVARVNPRRRPRGEPVPDAFWHLARRASWTPDELLLFESRREGPGPPHYAALERWPLEPGQP